MNIPPALILAGGFGTRLRAVESEKPKPMVEVHGKPFLYWLVRHLQKSNFREFIFSTGYKADHIENYPWAQEFPELQFHFAREVKPLGTGGAVLNIFKTLPHIENAWVINGDTVLENPLRADDVQPPNGATSAYYAALEASDVFDARPNMVVHDQFVMELNDLKGTLFDPGQVFISRKALAARLQEFDSEKNPPVSLKEVLKDEMKNKKVSYKIIQSLCFDIGTPERLLRFSQSSIFKN